MRFIRGLGALALLPLAFADDSQKLLSIDHYVLVRSSVPVISGQPAHIYVR